MEQNQINIEDILLWDPDFTKVTKDEAHAIEIADKEMQNGIYYTEDEIWNQT